MNLFTCKSTAPCLYQKSARGSFPIPLDSKLLDERSLIITDINSRTALDVFLILSHLTKTDEPIKIFICSNGGEIIAGEMIYDLIQGCKNDVYTYCIGRAASMGAIILAAGTKGHRYILPHSEVMIHEVLVPRGIGGSATNISKLSQSINKSRNTLNRILAKHTGRTIEEINEATSFDNFMTPEQAIEFGICDRLIDSVF